VEPEESICRNELFWHLFLLRPIFGNKFSELCKFTIYFQPWVLLFFSLLLGQNAMVDIFGGQIMSFTFAHYNGFQASPVVICTFSSKMYSQANPAAFECWKPRGFSSGSSIPLQWLG
jgi:hypothetical protein